MFQYGSECLRNQVFMKVYPFGCFSFNVRSIELCVPLILLPFLVTPKWLNPKMRCCQFIYWMRSLQDRLWVFGMNSYENLEQKHLVACSYRQNGRSYIGILDYVKNKMSMLDIPFTDINNITSGFCCLYIEGASGVLPLSIAKVLVSPPTRASLFFP